LRTIHEVFHERKIPPEACSATGICFAIHPSFSLVLGGPLFQLLRRVHLSDDALMMVRQRIIVIALLAWLPLAVCFRRWKGELWGGSTVAVPFLKDIEVHIRFLVALPC
jgi:hypothetical protein